ncbi:MAG TPA: hypothetical protein VFE24_06280 [Pirellulales bacterium]|jgi:hypothetical protein|nr:hypothetical protein [Pirellulales bacterium]
MIQRTEKPSLGLASEADSSRIGENVRDLIDGSGSTRIALQQTHRKAFLTELDRPQCGVIVQRWNKFTGRKAECTRPGGRFKLMKNGGDWEGTPVDLEQFATSSICNCERGGTRACTGDFH